MTTTRKEIRHALAALLIGEDGAHPTAAGRSVFPSRTRPISSRRCPLVLIFSQHDGPTEPVNGDIETRRLELSVIVATAGEDADDMADDLAADVRSVVQNDFTLGGLVQAMTWGTETLLSEQDGEDPIVAADMRLTVDYHTAGEDDDEGTVPERVLASWAPKIGPAHRDDYRPFWDAAEDMGPPDGTAG